MSTLFDEHGLAGQDIHNVAETELLESHRFGGHKVIRRSGQGGRGAGAEAERPDAVGVAEAEDAEAGYHGGAGEGALTLGVDVAQGAEQVVRVGTVLAELLEAVGEDV